MGQLPAHKAASAVPDFTFVFSLRKNGAFPSVFVFVSGDHRLVARRRAGTRYLPI